jgi:hypothetical protein
MEINFSALKCSIMNTKLNYCFLKGDDSLYGFV